MERRAKERMLAKKKRYMYTCVYTVYTCTCASEKRVMWANDDRVNIKRV